MKSIAASVLAGISLCALVSCEPTNSLRQGGGAFDDSETGRKLDGNALLPDPENPAEQSREDWLQLTE